MSNVSQYREDEPHGNENFGTLVLVVMKDVAEALADADGDYIPLIVDSSGRLHTISKISDGTNEVAINSEGQMHVVLMGKVSDDNCTSTPLDADAVFTGTAVNILDFGFIFVTVFSDVVSATDGLSVQQSSDGINWDNTDEYTIPAGTGKTYSFQPAAKWLRVVYTNGDTDQAAFRLQTVLKKTSSKPSSHRIQDAIIDEDDAELVKAVLSGKTAQDVFVNFGATNGGNFKVSIEEFDEAVSLPAGDNNIGNVDIVSFPSIATSIKVSPVGGSETVDASGTAQSLVGSSTDAQMLFVQAKTGNTGAIYFGDSAVDKTTSKQTTLLQSQAITISADGGYKLDINEFWIDADNNDDGVDFLYL